MFLDLLRRDYSNSATSTFVSRIGRSRPDAHLVSDAFPGIIHAPVRNRASTPPAGLDKNPQIFLSAVSYSVPSWISWWYLVVAVFFFFF